MVKNNRDYFFELKKSNLFFIATIFFIFTIIWVLAAGFGSPIAIFAGFIFVKRYMAIVAVVVTMLLCDYFAFGSLSANWFGSKSMFVVYLALLFPIVFKNFLQRKLGVLRVAGAALASSTVFFIATNFAVWAFSPMYAKTFEGLVLCYTMAIPFFQNTIAGDLVWSGAIFGAYVALRNYSNLQIFNQKDSLIFN